MKLLPDLREFIELLNSESVRFLVIGAWAVNRYAEPRFTGDIDFFVDTDADSETKIRRVLTRFGFGEALPPVEQPLFDKQVIMLGRPPSRIDLITHIDGVEFSAAWSRRVSGDLDELPVHFISLDDLIRNKRVAGRDKDLADLRILEKLSGSS